ncbi:glycosyltransferase family 2 protein [Hufsiella ginkgonis]|uniref:Glycosyltransferase n=1 Tax=Hufsiella ginkgonis TaxID=2695274 RepID=A0A7K1Y3L7_9SPHI|nr:glycosyltransferase family A protein [Hufsiella ginkgonis]MXV17841.1 glycosyltransferase [Hufsiella ginkgonis]
MFLSVIIPTAGNTDALLRCLNALHRQGNGDIPFSVEMIVTDDALQDHTKTSLEKRFPAVKWVRGPHCGPAANRNNGSIHSNGDWLAFVDDHCIPDPDYLANIAKVICEHPSIQLIEGYTYTDREKRRYDEEAPVNLHGNNLWSGNLIIKRSLFLGIQGFCEELSIPALEDIDFHLTLRNHYIPLYFAPEIKVCHPWTKRRSLLSRLRSVDSVRILCQRHPSLKKELDQRRHLLKFIEGIRERTAVLLRFRFKGFRVYLEDNLVHIYYLIKR